MFEIPPNEINSPLSIDPNGRLFWWNEQPYRAIVPARVSFYRDLFERGIIQSLVDKGLLIHTEISDFHLAGYGLVLKHQLVPFVSYPQEWCAPMFKDAALLVINLQIELWKHNLALQDAHAWNVLFDGAHPVYVDLGSIVSVEDNAAWVAKNEFIETFIQPLQLMAEGHDAAARWLLQGIGQGSSGINIAELTNRFSLQQRAKRAMLGIYRTTKDHIPDQFRGALKSGVSVAKKTAEQVSTTSANSQLHEFYNLRTITESISLPHAKTEWADYNESHFPSFTETSDWRQKETTAYQVLSRLKPKTVLDMGSNRGWFSQLAATLGSTVVAFDVDTTGIARLFEDIKQRNLSVLPLLMDFRFPTPGIGLYYQWRKSATERFKCDLVMGIALSHHLVFKQNLSFEEIIDGMKIYTNRWLLVEFIPHDDQFVREWWTAERYSWYTLDNFRKALMERFSKVEMFPSSPDPRVMFLCEL